MNKNRLPILLIVTGILVIMSAAGILLYPNFAAGPQKPLLPPSLGGLSLMHARYGPEAVDGVIQLHGVQFPLEDAAIGYYGNQGEITLWVSVEPDLETAVELNDLMTEKIHEGRSPFSLPILTNMDDTDVYVLEGLGQQHYYWQVNTLIVWLAANFDIAPEVLSESLNYYR